MSAQAAYLEAEVLSASPPKLRLMLIEAALRLARQNLRDWQDPLPTSVLNALAHLRKIIRELLNSLESKHRDSAPDMHGVYMYLLRAVTEAQLRRDAGKIGEVVRILEVERETWRRLTQRYLEMTAVTQEPAPSRSLPPMPQPTASGETHTYSNWTEPSSGGGFSHVA